MGRLMRPGWFGFLLAWMLVLAGPALGQSSVDGDDAKARHLYNNGVMLYEEGRYSDAIAAWKAAYDLSPRPLLLYNIAEAQERVGMWQEALDTLNRYRAYAPAEERDRLTKRIENIEKHLRAQRAEEDARQAQVRSEPQPQAVPRPQVRPEPRPEPRRSAPPPQETSPRWRMGPLPISLYAVSGVGTVTGAVFAFRAQAARRAASEVCMGEITLFCPESARNAIEQDKISSIVADVGFGVALTGTVVATVVAVSSKNRANRTTMSLSPTSRGAHLGLSRTF